MSRDHRRLAAIISADVVGYSLLMGRDESATLAEMKSHRREIIDPKIAEHGGRIVKTTGDGLLLEFPSVVDAVRCAVDVQRGMAERNASVPPDRRIEFRIGINVGDIIIDGEDIFGDGINVAARLQTLAEPGGICVSRVVRDQVLDKLSFVFEDLGAQEVKNITRPVEVYRVNLGSDAQRIRNRGRWTWRLLKKSAPVPWLAAGFATIALVGAAAWTLTYFRTSTPVPSAPVLSVAILPFTASQGDVEAARFAETLTRSLTTGVPRKREYGSVYVVFGSSALTAGGSSAAEPRDAGRRLNVRYVLEGDVLRAAAEYVVNLRLVDAATGGQVWSERDTLHDADVAAESSASLRNLSARLRSVVAGAEGQRVADLPLSSLSARELVLRAFELGGKDGSRAGLAEAGKLVDEALRREPDLVPALVLRAAILNNQGGVDPELGRDRVVREQDELTARAVRLDDTNPAAWNWRGIALEDLGRWDAALDANALAIKLDPYESRWRMFRANIMVQAARPAEALTVIDQTLALDPPNVGSLMGTACEAYMLIGQMERAITTCEKASALTSAFTIPMILAAAYANQGDMAKATAAKAQALRIVPNLTIASARQLSNNPEYVKLAESNLYGGLRKAGFPEK